MPLIKVKPRDGQNIPDPHNAEPLPPEGREVKDSPYWRRRLRDKSVVLLVPGNTQPPHAPEPEAPAEQLAEAETEPPADQPNEPEAEAQAESPAKKSPRKKSGGTGPDENEVA